MEGIYERADMDKPFMGLPPFPAIFRIERYWDRQKLPEGKSASRSESGGIQIICFHDRILKGAEKKA